jgi:hypothetical protein
MDGKTETLSEETYFSSGIKDVLMAQLRCRCFSLELSSFEFSINLNVASGSFGI